MNEIIPKGALLTVTTGIYSDYHVRGVFRASSDIDAFSLLAEWLSLHPDQKQPYHFKEGNFLAWVSVTKNVLEPVDSYEWHLTDYGEPEEMDVSGSTRWEAETDS